MPSDSKKFLKLECSKCRALRDPDEYKVCSGCKVVGYCSKKCQKAHWPSHKTSCLFIQNGKPVLQRHPLIKFVEHLRGDKTISSSLVPVLVAALDLTNHPENADKFCVMLVARLVPITSDDHYDDVAPARPGYKTPRARASSSLPGVTKHPKFVHLVRTYTLPLSVVGDTVGMAAIHCRRTTDALSLRDPRYTDAFVLRALWIPEDGVSAISFVDSLSRDLLERVEEVIQLRGKKAGKDTMDWLINHFNRQRRIYPEIREKVTVMDSVEDK
ncbi:hypothetical protein SERLA73DRAFT_178199 [Serpula lacrymans var. lacrymans S7.3]|uniref:MYND-type domain-containing protein n=2 Tax=Serpula lacrymans var. lacrymans TaxID=341189 RepID=F8PQX2_SERL3|nr:uncharacterized protein SERLADRAFT_462501 [Serpula lacrymans var. lacrymans S7.9]EGO02316.1 hypothetical protein SERLA73DRAFT_178199 [Serpula lacrymans var. lacrymans S7.3]EGO28053.1 hypothetical protein SERLADRAFT_462501 [Serpula lacrymans var. lacrymans S7.9]